MQRHDAYDINPFTSLVGRRCLRSGGNVRLSTSTRGSRTRCSSPLLFKHVVCASTTNPEKAIVSQTHTNCTDGDILTRSRLISSAAILLLPIDPKRISCYDWSTVCIREPSPTSMHEEQVTSFQALASMFPWQKYREFF